MDETENKRRELVKTINSAAASLSSDVKDIHRRVLKKFHGEVWDSEDLTRDFEVKGFLAPFVVVKHKETGKTGSLLFQHHPRFYFDWAEDKEA